MLRLHLAKLVKRHTSPVYSRKPDNLPFLFRKTQHSGFTERLLRFTKQNGFSCFFLRLLPPCDTIKVRSHGKYVHIYNVLLDIWPLNIPVHIRI